MMRTKTETTISVVWGFFLRIVILAAVIYAIYRVRTILVAVVLAAMLTYVALPAIDFLCARRVRGWTMRSQRFWASTLVFLTLLTVTVVTIRYIAAPFINEAKQIQANISVHAENVKTLSSRATGWYADLPKELKSQIDVSRKTGTDAVLKWVAGMLGGTIAWAGHFLDIILIPVLAFYFAFDYRSLRREFVGILPRARRREAVLLLRHIGKILQNYVVGQLVLCLIAGVGIGLLLWALDINYALALGVFAGITRAIPIIGPIISGVVIVVLGLLKAPIVGVYLLAVFCTLHLVESKFILPKLIGHQMRLHPAMILIVLLMGGEFFGLMGMFLAAPVAAIIRELVRFYVISPRDRREAEVDNVVTLPPPSLQSGAV